MSGDIQVDLVVEAIIGRTLQQSLLEIMEEVEEQEQRDRNMVV